MSCADSLAPWSDWQDWGWAHLERVKAPSEIALRKPDERRQRARLRLQALELADLAQSLDEAVIIWPVEPHDPRAWPELREGARVQVIADAYDGTEDGPVGLWLASFGWSGEGK